MSQELWSDRFPALKGTYGDISWHKMRRMCTWLWGCAPAEKMWGCTQTAGGTGSRRPRCHWNWCTPAKKKSTRPRSAEDGEQTARCHFGGILDSAAVPHLSYTKWEKNWTTDPEQWCKLQMFSHKPLKCFVVTQAVTAVIELDELSCELLLQYSICGRCGGGVREWLIKGTLIGTTNQQIGQKSFTAP